LDKLIDEFNLIQEENTDYDISQHLATIDDLPDLGEIELYDYEADLNFVTNKGLEILSSLVDFYFSDYPEIKDHPYIKNKLNEDAMVYAETLFLQRMTRKNFLHILKQIDNGDNSARMHEVVNQTIKEIRENSKFASTQRNDLERYYKEFRLDVIESSQYISDKSNSDDDGVKIDNKNLNDMINNMIKNK
jgi:hypothetical protein